MHIAPKQRRRCLKVHHLSMAGVAQRKIAKQLGVSHVTVRSDLRLIEAHWSDIAAPAADDLLLEQLQLLREQTARIARTDLMEAFGSHITVAEYIKACDARDAKVLAFIRETRRTIDAVHRRAAEREAQPELYQGDLESLQETDETAPKLDKTVHPNSASPQPEQEIVALEPPPEKFPPKAIQPAPDPSTDPLLDPILEEAVTLFPHLKGQPPDQILAFLDQLTEPTPSEDPLPIYADAAGGG
ncbi:MAG: hypothetical protein OXT70_13520 [Chloroflexota bacterium]|nr:hypothetical protein [Chloroflexota bacterium]